MTRDKSPLGGGSTITYQAFFVRQNFLFVFAIFSAKKKLPVRLLSALTQVSHHMVRRAFFSPLAIAGSITKRPRFANGQRTPPATGLDDMGGAADLRDVGNGAHIGDEGVDGETPEVETLWFECHLTTEIEGGVWGSYNVSIAAAVLYQLCLCQLLFLDVRNRPDLHAARVSCKRNALPVDLAGISWWKLYCLLFDADVEIFLLAEDRI